MVTLNEKDVTFDIEYIDLSGYPREEQEDLGYQLYDQQDSKPFKLGSELLFRIKLIKADKSLHAILFTTNHIVFDGWSAGVLDREIRKLHEQRLAGEDLYLPPVKARFRDYAAWKHHFFTDPELNGKNTEFWKAHFKDFTDYPFLPYDFRKKSKTDKSAGYTFFVDAATNELLKQTAKRYDTSSYMILVSCAFLLLCQETGKTDLSVGFPHVNRQFEALDDVIGEFAGPVPLRLQIDTEKPYSEFLSRVTNTVFDIINRPKYPSYYLKEFFNLDTLHRFSMFVQQITQGNIDKEIDSFEGVHTKEIPNARFEFGIYPSEYKNGLGILIKYKKRLYRPESIADYAHKYLKILEKISKGTDFSMAFKDAGSYVH